jgi:hypothetical protein
VPINGKFSELLIPDLKKIYFDMTFVRKPPKKETWALIGNVSVLRATERAILIRVPPMGKQILPVECWIPKSMINTSESEVLKLGDAGFLVIPEWLAREKGLL